jgi:hypothetical protein
MTDIQTAPLERPASQGALVEQTRAVAEVAAAVRVAQDNPRSEALARQNMLETCGRLAVANRAFYEVPNRGAGPSIHLARELARVWGNLDYGVRELSRDDDAGTSEMQVWAWDQQTNARSTRSFIAPHIRMVGKGAAKKRELLTDIGDIYLSNQNVGARAVRECIFAVLPGWFVDEAVTRCRETVKKGDGLPLDERIANAVAGFASLHITVGQLEAHLDSKRTTWRADDLARLARIYSSITVDGISADEYFQDSAIDLTALPTSADPAAPLPGEAI